MSGGSEKIPFRIEQAEEGDWPFIVQGQVEIAWARLDAEHRRPVGREEIEEHVARRVQALRRDEGFPNLAFVAKTDDGTPAGYVWIARTHNDSTGQHEASLLSQYVAAPHRGQGLGSRLMEAAEGWAREMGLPRISLSVGVRNRPGQMLYESLGYQVETLRMSKVLSEPDAVRVLFGQQPALEGLDVDTFAPRLSFFLAAHNNFFEEIAKFRAARRIWARLMREKFKAKNPLSWKFRFHAQTSGVTLLSRQPDNNIVRVTLQALAAVLGGTQSLHTNARDEALALPSEESAQIALRTQQIIAYESGVAETIDPLGGSFFIELLTTQLEEKVKAYLQKIEDMGGMMAAIEKGYVQKEIQESAYSYQKKVEKKEQIVVGLNEYAKEDEKIQFKLYHPPQRIEKTQIERLRRIRKKRSEDKVKDLLDSLRKAVQAEKNLLLPIIEAVKESVTLGEISSVLKDAYGTYDESIVI